MVHSKNRSSSGFMLMEVMVTIAIVGLVLAPVFMLQSSAMRGLQRLSREIRLLFSAKNVLVDSFQKVSFAKDEEETETKRISNPPATLTYKRAKVGKNSAFKDMKNLYSSDVRIRSSRAERESIIGFVYKPEKEKK